MLEQDEGRSRIPGLLEAGKTAGGVCCGQTIRMTGVLGPV